MPGLSLRARRLRSLGVNARQVVGLNGRYLRGFDANRATLTTSMTGSNNDLFLAARTPGTTGNSTRLRIVVSGNNTALSVSVSSQDITVNSATDGSGVATSKAVDVVKALKASAPALALVWPSSHFANNDGSGVVTALSYTSLSGGAAAQ